MCAIPLQRAYLGIGIDAFQVSTQRGVPDANHAIRCSSARGKHVAVPRTPRERLHCCLVLRQAMSRLVRLHLFQTSARPSTHRGVPNAQQVLISARCLHTIDRWEEREERYAPALCHPETTTDRRSLVRVQHKRR